MRYSLRSRPIVRRSRDQRVVVYNQNRRSELARPRHVSGYGAAPVHEIVEVVVPAPEALAPQAEIIEPAISQGPVRPIRSLLALSYDAARRMGHNYTVANQNNPYVHAAVMNYFRRYPHHSS